MLKEKKKKNYNAYLIIIKFWKTVGCLCRERERERERERDGKEKKIKCQLVTINWKTKRL